VILSWCYRYLSSAVPQYGMSVLAPTFPSEPWPRSEILLRRKQRPRAPIQRQLIIIQQSILSVQRCMLGKSLNANGFPSPRYTVFTDTDGEQRSTSCLTTSSARQIESITVATCLFETLLSIGYMHEPIEIPQRLGESEHILTNRDRSTVPACTD